MKGMGRMLVRLALCGCGACAMHVEAAKRKDAVLWGGDAQLEEIDDADWAATIQ